MNFCNNLEELCSYASGNKEVRNIDLLSDGRVRWEYKDLDSWAHTPWTPIEEEFTTLLLGYVNQAILEGGL